MSNAARCRGSSRSSAVTTTSMWKCSAPCPFGQPAPMQRDTIFRIASLTKPVTAVAAMMLVEECKMRLDDSIEPWLPGARESPRARSPSPRRSTTPCPAKRAITVRDLLTYRMGFGSVMAMPDTYPIQRSIRELRIGGDGPPLRPSGPSTDEWLRRARLAPVDGAARRAVDVSRERRRPRRADRARVRTIARRVHARAPLRSARHERHGVLRA